MNNFVKNFDGELQFVASKLKGRGFTNYGAFEKVVKDMFITIAKDKIDKVKPEIECYPNGYDNFMKKAVNRVRELASVEFGVKA